jgi:hypothetical protein
MNDLVQFLRARLDEDEEIARAATQGDWVWSREFVSPPGYHHRTIGPLEPGDSAFIAAHEPARVLAEVEAKRVLLADYERFVAERRRMMGGWDSYPEASPVLTAFAAVYADHPDYRQEWRP